MNETQLMAKNIAEKGRINIYYQRDRPYLSLRISTPREGPTGKFLQYYADEYGIGVIQHFGNNIAYTVGNRKAERFLLDNTLFHELMEYDNMSEILDIVMEYDSEMMLKREKHISHNPENIKKLSDRLREINVGKGTRTKKDIQEALKTSEEREVPPEFLGD